MAYTGEFIYQGLAGGQGRRLQAAQQASQALARGILAAGGSIGGGIQAKNRAEQEEEARRLAAEQQQQLAQQRYAEQVGLLGAREGIADTRRKQDIARATEQDKLQQMLALQELKGQTGTILQTEPKMQEKYGPVLAQLEGEPETPQEIARRIGTYKGIIGVDAPDNKFEEWKKKQDILEAKRKKVREEKERTRKKRAAEKEAKGRDITPAELAGMRENAAGAQGITNLRKVLKDNAEYFGKVGGPGTKLSDFVGKDAKATKIIGEIGLLIQIVGRPLEGGMLRQDDIVRYEKMLPSLNDTPEAAIEKLKTVEDLLMFNFKFNRDYFDKQKVKDEGIDYTLLDRYLERKKNTEEVKPGYVDPATIERAK